MSRSSVPAVILLVLLAAGLAAGAEGPLRPPAVPLITHDPYFSIWSAADRLNIDWPRHWTGRIHSLSGLVRVDGKPYRVIGSLPSRAPAMSQASLDISPTRTVYVFKDAGIELTADFLSPLLASDLDILARPASYVTFSVRSLDGQAHQVALYFDASSEIAVNETHQNVVWSRLKLDGLEALAIGTRDQPVLARRGDDLRIDWG